MYTKNGYPKSYLPGVETGRAEQVAARLNANVLVIFGANFAQLKGGAHLAVQLVLLLRHANVIFRRGHHSLRQVGIHIAPVWVAVTGDSVKSES